MLLDIGAVGGEKWPSWVCVSVAPLPILLPSTKKLFLGNVVFLQNISDDRRKVIELLI